MKPQNSRGGGRRGRGPRRSNRSRSEGRATPTPPPRPQSFWQKVVSFFKGGAQNGSAPKVAPRTQAPAPALSTKPPRPRLELLEVTSEKLYVGNLSYDATESDLFELFKGVGSVRNAEIVSDRHTDRSKGFGFVTMATIEEARRAVGELHDKDFMGRKLVVSGARTTERETNYRG